MEPAVAASVCQISSFASLAGTLDIYCPHCASALVLMMLRCLAPGPFASVLTWRVFFFSPPPVTDATPGRANKLAPAAPCTVQGGAGIKPTRRLIGWPLCLVVNRPSLSPDSLSANSLISPNDLESAGAPATRVRTNHEILIWHNPTLPTHPPRLTRSPAGVERKNRFRELVKLAGVFSFCPQAA